MLLYHDSYRRIITQYPIRQCFMSFWIWDRPLPRSRSSFLIFELLKSCLALFGSSIDNLFFETEHASLEHRC